MLILRGFAGAPIVMAIGGLEDRAHNAALRYGHRLEAAWRQGAAVSGSDPTPAR